MTAIRILAAAACLLAQTTVAGHLDVQLNLATDYVFRGLSQTASGPAWQGMVEYRFEPGFYAGVWASRVDYARRSDRRDTEVDWFVGYQRRINPGLAFDLAAVRYTFTEQAHYDYDWTELQASLHIRDGLTFNLSLADNWFGRDAPSTVAEVTYRYPLPAGLVVDATAGYAIVDRFFEDNYGFAGIGVAREFGSFAVRLGMSATDSGADRFREAGDTRWLASITWAPQSRAVGR